jgi:hypothetical protein
MDRLAPRLPPGVEVGIGRFIANFALLEEYLRGIVCEIGRTSAPAGEILSSELSFRGLLECFGALVREYVADGQLHSEAEHLLKQVNSINEFRNRLVHSLWLPDHSSRVFAVRQKLASSRKRGFSAQVERFKRRDLISKSDEIAELTFRISDLYHRIEVEQAARPDGPTMPRPSRRGSAASRYATSGQPCYEEIGGSHGRAEVGA